jgi:hypothetical protein
MLLDHDSEAPSSPSPDPSPRNASGPIVVFVVALLLAVGVYIVSSHSGSGGTTTGAVPHGSPTINNEGGSPPPTIFEVKAGPPIPPVAKEWAVCANASYEYWFEYPTAWTLSIPPDYTPQGASRLLQSPKARSVAILVVPFGLYGSNRDAEIGKAEAAYLGDHSIDPGTDKKLQVNGLEALHREYTCRVKTAAGFDTSKAVAVMIIGKTMGYAIFLRGDDGDLKEAMPVFDRLVSSFKVEKLPLRAVGTAPAAAVSGAPSSSASAAPSEKASAAPLAGESGAPAAVEKPSDRPAAEPSAGPARVQPTSPSGTRGATDGPSGGPRSAGPSGEAAPK